MVLLTVRQYEGKSYRMFSEWLVEAYYLRMFLQLSHIPHYLRSSEVFFQNKWYIIGKDSFILRIANWQYQKKIISGQMIRQDLR